MARLGSNKSVWKAIVDYLGSKCIYCGGLDVDIHHIIPVSRGGQDNLANFELVCSSCHRKIHDEWNKIMPIKSFYLKECDKCGKKFERKRNIKKIFCSNCHYKSKLKSNAI